MGVRFPHGALLEKKRKDSIMANVDCRECISCIDDCGLDDNDITRNYENYYDVPSIYCVDWPADIHGRCIVNCPCARFEQKRGE
jgi:hypothetical protein